MLKAYIKLDASQTVNIENAGSYLVKFELKLSSQMEKKTKQKWNWNGWGDKIESRHAALCWGENTSVKKFILICPWCFLDTLVCWMWRWKRKPIAQSGDSGVQASWEMLLNYIHLYQRLLSIVSWFSKSGPLVLDRSKISFILTGLGPQGSKCAEQTINLVRIIILSALT